MNRQERRIHDREMKKDMEVIKKLTPTQAKLIDKASKSMANEYISNFEKLVDRSLSAALIDYGINYTDINMIENNMSKLLVEDTEKTEKLERENIDMAKMQKEVQEAVEKVLKEGKNKNQAIEELMDRFPTLSKSMLLNAYAKIKQEKGYVETRIPQEVVFAEIEKDANILNAKQRIAKIMAKFKFTESTAQTYYYKWKKEYMKDKESSPTKDIVSEEAQDNAEKIIEAVRSQEKPKEIKEEVQMSGLKVIEEIKKIKVEGTNGIYEAETGKGVALKKEAAQISFANEKELDEFTEEYRKVLKMIAI